MKGGNIVLVVPPLQPVGPPGCHVSPSREHRSDIGWLTDGSARTDPVCHHGFYIPSFWRVQQERHVEWKTNSILDVDALTSAMFLCTRLIRYFPERDCEFVVIPLSLSA